MLWQIRVKNSRGQICNLGQPMTWKDCRYWLSRVRQMHEWCQAKKVNRRNK